MPENRKLTERETQIVKLISEGYKNREVAEMLLISVKTVETHRANIMNKLTLRNIAGLIRYAVQKGLVVIKKDDPPFLDRSISDLEASYAAERREVPDR